MSCLWFIMSPLRGKNMQKHQPCEENKRKVNMSSELYKQTSYKWCVINGTDSLVG